MGGLILGTTVTGLAALLPAPARVGTALGIGSLGILAVYSGTLRRSLPERACQVSAIKARKSNEIGVGFSWGFELGTGLRTYTITPTIYVLVATFILIPPVPGVVGGLSYGLARGSAIVIASMYRPKADRQIARAWAKSTRLLALTLSVLAMLLTAKASL